MLRFASAVVLFVLMAASPIWAAEGAALQAPSAAVEAAWARENIHQGPSAATLNAMVGSYAALQAFDMVSTVRARQAGAREVNPLLAGGYGQATAMKAALAIGAIGAIKVMGKKNRKAAFVTAVVLNIAGAAVVATNMRNLHHLQPR